MKTLVTLVCLALIGYNAVAQESAANIVPKTVIIKLKKSSLKVDFNGAIPVSSNIQKLFNTLQVSAITKEFPNFKPSSKPNSTDLSTIYEFTYTLNYPVYKVVSYLKTLPEVEYAQPEYVCHPLDTAKYVPSDPMIGQQDYLARIMAEQAWAICKGDTNVVIGISDTGFDINNPELKNQVKINYNDPINGKDDDGDGYIDNYYGWDMADNDNDVTNYQEKSPPHGTTVAGFASAQTDNGIGVAGAGFKCKFLPVRVGTNSAEPTLVRLYQSIDYLAEHGASIINCSWGGPGSQDPMAQEIINYAVNEKDVVVVAAAGNNNTDALFYPASFDNVVSVTATGSADDNKWSSSSYNYYVDIAAPGENMWGITSNNGYMLHGGGTSYASPLVSGTLGIIRSHFPKYNAHQAFEQLRIAADNIDTVAANVPYKNMLGYGRINMYKALTDTLVPSIRLINYSISGLYGNLLLGGDTLVLKGTLVNYLHVAKNITLNISANENYITKIQVPAAIDSLGTLDSIKDVAFRFILNNSVPKDANIVIFITYDNTATGFHDYQMIPEKVNQSSLPIITNTLATTVTGVGSIGYFPGNIYQGLGFTYLNQQLLEQGSGLVLATDTGNVIFIDSKNQNYVPIDYPAYYDTDSTIVVKCSYQAQKAGTIGFDFKVIQTATAYKNDSSFVIYTFDIINNSLINIDSIYTGLFMDFGVGNTSTNLANINVSKNYGYTYSVENGLPYVGVKSLSTGSANQYVIDGIYASDTNINLTNGLGMTNKDFFYAMSHAKSQLKNASIAGTDVMQMINSKTNNFNIGDTIHTAYAIFVSSNEKAIAQTIQRVDYRSNISDSNNITAVNNVSIAHFTVIPNPTSKENIRLEFDSKISGACTIILTDNKGAIVNDTKRYVTVGKNYITVSGLKDSGVYYITLICGDFSRTEMVVRQ